MIVDDEERAKRLARAICTDVMLYNGETVRGVPPELRGSAIAEAVQEGRELFVSRVTPALAPIYELAVAELVAEPLGIAVSAIRAAGPQPHPGAPPVHPGEAMATLYGAPPYMSARGFEEAGREPTARRRKASSVPLVAAILFALLAAACWYFLPRMQW